MQNLMIDSVFNSEASLSPRISRSHCRWTAFACFVFGLLIGISISYVVLRDKRNLNADLLPSIPDNSAISSPNDTISNALLNSVDAQSIGDYLKCDTDSEFNYSISVYEKYCFNFRILSSKPRLAGTAADEEMALYVYNEWKLMGMQTKMINYTVLLSYPDEHNPNLVLQTNTYCIISLHISHSLRYPESTKTAKLFIIRAYLSCH